MNQGGFNYAHNADGFMTQRGVETLVYSARGELLEPTAGGNTVTYAYDGYGRRVGRKNGSENWYQYLYADPQKAYPVTATRDPGGVLTTYHYDDFGHLFAFQRGVDWYYVATDQVGTPRVVSDATGNIIKTLDYDSYGVLIADSNPGFDLPIGFAGGISDRVTGLVRFGARDYDPVIGRWTAKDPIMFRGGQMNLYEYSSSNPVNYIDPDGLTEISIWYIPIGVIKGALDLIEDPEEYYYRNKSCKNEAQFGRKYLENKKSFDERQKQEALEHRIDSFRNKMVSTLPTRRNRKDPSCPLKVKIFLEEQDKAMRMKFLMREAEDKEERKGNRLPLSES